MRHLLIIFASAALFATATAHAGAPKPEHPCYAVADCKTQPSRQAFSACIKANKEEASQNEACATFRKDKAAWLKEQGIATVDDLFES